MNHLNDIDHIITKAQFIVAVLASTVLQRPKYINSLRSVIIKIHCHDRQRNSSAASKRALHTLRYAYIVKLKRTAYGCAELWLISEETNVMFFFFTKYDCVMITF